MRRTSLVIGSAVTDSFAGLVAKGRELALHREETMAAVVVSKTLRQSDAEKLGASGAELVYQLPLDPRDINSEKTAVKSLVSLQDKLEMGFLLFENSIYFGAVAPAFAAATGNGIVADCTGLEPIEEHSILQIRPTYGGKRIAHIINNRGKEIATVRKGVFECQMLPKAPIPPVEVLPIKEQRPFWTLKSIISDSTEYADLSTADVILSGGLGVGSRENYQKLYTLAHKWGVAVGASRAAVAAGYAGYEHQVGQTGQTVRPKVYIAFGIAGAIQHVSGIMGAKSIVAINNDPKAPIHEYSDYSIIADCNEVIDHLLRIN